MTFVRRGPALIATRGCARVREKLGEEKKWTFFFPSPSPRFPLNLLLKSKRKEKKKNQNHQNHQNPSSSEN